MVRAGPQHVDVAMLSAQLSSMQGVMNDISISQKRTTPILINQVMRNANFWTPSKVTADRDKQSRAMLKKHLGYEKKSNVKCMVAEITGNGDQVTAAHIVPRGVSLTDAMDTLGMNGAQINSARNMLFLSANIETAFDSLLLCFVKSNPLQDKYFLKVCDEATMSKPIWPDHATTIGSLQGRQLVLDGHEPYKRCLSYQAYETWLNHHASFDIIQDHCMYGTPDSCRFMTNMQLLQDDVNRIVATEMEMEEDDEGGEDEDEEDI